MKTYFIRHKSDDSHEIKELLGNNLISIFYDNAPWDAVSKKEFWDQIEHQDKKGSKRYSAYKTSVEYFKEISNNGGWIFSEYGSSLLSSGKKGCLLGEIRKGTEVKVHKDLNVTLQLANVTEIEYSKYPVLLAIRPPFGTICSPNRKTYSTLAESLMLNKPLVPDLTLMHPTVVEQMCVEHLRLHGLESDKEMRLDYLFLNVGKTMATYDIAGRINNGKKVFCQVKHGPIHPQTEEHFIKSIPNDAIGVIYADNVENKTVGNIYYRNIKDIYHTLNCENPQMINDMIGIAA